MLIGFYIECTLVLLVGAIFGDLLKDKEAAINTDSIEHIYTD
jgi:hypothetical protein